MGRPRHTWMRAVTSDLLPLNLGSLLHTVDWFRLTTKDCKKFTIGYASLNERGEYNLPHLASHQHSHSHGLQYMTIWSGFGLNDSKPGCHIQQSPLAYMHVPLYYHQHRFLVPDICDNGYQYIITIVICIDALLSYPKLGLALPECKQWRSWFSIVTNYIEESLPTSQQVLKWPGQNV